MMMKVNDISSLSSRPQADSQRRAILASPTAADGIHLIFLHNRIASTHWTTFKTIATHLKLWHVFLKTMFMSQKSVKTTLMNVCKFIFN